MSGGIDSAPSSTGVAPDERVRLSPDAARFPAVNSTPRRFLALEPFGLTPPPFQAHRRRQQLPRDRQGAQPFPSLVQEGQQLRPLQEPAHLGPWRTQQVG